MRILVMGYIVRSALGGMCWHHMQYVLGLKQMGHEVLFLEDSDDYASCYNPASFETTTDPSHGISFIKDLFGAFGLQEHWAFFDAHTNKWFGKEKRELVRFCSGCDLVINLSGIQPLREWWVRIPRRVLIDTDPAFTQIRHLTDPEAMRVAAQHTSFFSFGERYGQVGCTIPIDGFAWQATRQPVFLPAWKVKPGNRSGTWTTVMQWDSYQVRSHNGASYGMKSASFSPYVELPRKLPDETFELAMGSPNAPSGDLHDKGWRTINPLIPTRTPWTYREYVGRSKGEWTVAKHGYVASRSGWFSERSLCYMASGRPVVVQNTGLEDILPSGAGVFLFNNPEEAINSIQEADRNYEFHCRQARKIAEGLFAAENVLASLLERAF